MVTQHTVVQHTVENILVWSFMHIDLHFIVEGRTFLRATPRSIDSEKHFERKISD